MGTRPASRLPGIQSPTRHRSSTTLPGAAGQVCDFLRRQCPAEDSCLGDGAKETASPVAVRPDSQGPLVGDGHRRGGAGGKRQRDHIGREGARVQSLRHERIRFGVPEDNLDDRLVGHLLVWQLHNLRGKVLPGLAIHGNARNLPLPRRGQIEPLQAETDGKVLLQPRDLRWDMRHDRQPVRAIEVLEQPADHGCRHAPVVIHTVDRQPRLVGRIAEIDQRVVHTEPPGVVEHLLHRTPRVLVLAEPIIGHDHPRLAG